MKILNNSSVKLSSIYYINNTALLTLQLIQKELNLFHKCNVKYFDSKFFFLQVDWDSFDFRNTTIVDFKNNIIFNTINTKQLFLIPVALLINSRLVSYSHFIEIISFNSTFDIFTEINNWANIPNLTLTEVSVFLFNPALECLNNIQSNPDTDFSVNDI